MNRRAWGMLAACIVLAPAAAHACGDKFLVIGRSPGRVPKARHPATIALYLRAGSELPAAAKEMRLDKTLKQAGHKVELIRDPSALREAMASGHLDFVIADPGDAQGLSRSLPAAAPLIVPLTRGDEDRASSAYPVVIRAGKSLSYLSALDAAKAGRPEPPPR